MEKERIELYQKLISVSWLTKSGIAKKYGLAEDVPLYDGTYDRLLADYFTNEAGVRELWNLCLQYDVSQLNFNEFFQKYACDFAWSSKLKYCTSRFSWAKYPCVVKAAQALGVEMGDNESYTINGLRYFKNGRVADANGNISNYDCSDPNLKAVLAEKPKSGDAKTGGESASGYKPCSSSYTRGCYSDKIKEAQICLGLTADGKFGAKTEAALKAIGFPNGFTNDDIRTICTGGRNIIKSWMDKFPTCVRGLNPYENGENSRFYGMGTGSDGKLYHIYYYDKKYKNGLFCQVKSVEDGVEWINGFYGCETNGTKININTSFAGLTVEGSVLNPDTPKNRPIKPEDKLKDERKTVSPDIGV